MILLLCECEIHFYFYVDSRNYCLVSFSFSPSKFFYGKHFQSSQYLGFCWELIPRSWNTIGIISRTWKKRKLHGLRKKSTSLSILHIFHKSYSFAYEQDLIFTISYVNHVRILFIFIFLEMSSSLNVYINHLFYINVV